MQNGKDRATWRAGVADHRRRVAALLVAVGLTFAASCGGDDDTDPDDAGDQGSVDTSSPSEESTEASVEGSNAELQEVDIVLGWLAEPSRGGLFAAEQQGYFEEAGVKSNLISGTDISAVQLVGAGRADFGIGDADELLAAREQGIPIVALAAGFQTNPRILLYHASAPADDFRDLNGRTVYIDLGDDWWEWVKEEFELTEVSERAYTGQLSSFINDEQSLVQGYVGSEDVVLAEEGIDVGTLRVGDSGFNPYTNILFTTMEYAEQNPELVRAVIGAHNAGWDFYRTGYATVNEYMRAFNEELSLEGMNETALAQEDFIFGGDAETHGVGHMSEERWTELDQQLRDIGVLTEDTGLDTIIWASGE